MASGPRSTTSIRRTASSATATTQRRLRHLPVRERFRGPVLRPDPGDLAPGRAQDGQDLRDHKERCVGADDRSLADPRLEPRVGAGVRACGATGPAGTICGSSIGRSITAATRTRTTGCCLRSDSGRHRRRSAVRHPTAPAAGAYVSDHRLRATASDDEAVSTVEFFEGGTSLGAGTLSNGVWRRSWTPSRAGICHRDRHGQHRSDRERHARVQRGQRGTHGLDHLTR